MRYVKLGKQARTADSGGSAARKPDGEEVIKFVALQDPDNFFIALLLLN